LTVLARIITGFPPVYRLFRLAGRFGMPVSSVVSLAPSFVKGGREFVEVVAVDFQDLESEGAPLSAKGESHDVLGKAVDHQPVAVHDGITFLSPK
jgi:hypothetical protein